VSITSKIYRHRKRLGMTQAELAEKAGLSESAIRSYELGNRIPKPAHREAIAKALGINPKTLDDFFGEDVDATIQCLMDMESNDIIRPVLIDGIAYLMPIQVDMETGVQEWAEKQLEYAYQGLGDDEYATWKDSYKQAGAQKRTAVNAVNAHYDFRKARGKRAEEELAKLPLESDREAIRETFENANGIDL
jgi:transcriptional regulator with XRE-family HTH domain